MTDPVLRTTREILLDGISYDVTDGTNILLGTRDVIEKQWQVVRYRTIRSGTHEKCLNCRDTNSPWVEVKTEPDWKKICEMFGTKIEALMYSDNARLVQVGEMFSEETRAWRIAVEQPQGDKQ